MSYLGPEHMVSKPSRTTEPPPTPTPATSANLLPRWARGSTTDNQEPRRAADPSVVKRSGTGDDRSRTVVDLVEIDGGWRLSLRGYTEAGAAAGYLWPGGTPTGVEVDLLVALVEPEQIGQFQITGVTSEALRAMTPQLAQHFSAQAPVTAAAAAQPSAETQYYEFTVGPDDTGRPHVTTLQRSTVTNRADYIDNRMTHVEYGIYLGGFNVYVGGRDTEPIFISNKYLVEDRVTSVSVGDRIFDTVTEAQRSVAAFTVTGDHAARHAYYWGAGGAVVAPTVISAATTPRIVATLLAARAELGRQVSAELAVLAGNMILIGALGRLYRWLRAPSPPGDPVPQTPSRPREPADGASPDAVGGGKAPTGRGTAAEVPEPATATATGVTPKTPPPAPRTLSNAVRRDIAALKDEGFVYERLSADGRTADYRNPATGQRAYVTLRQGGPSWMNPAWGRGRLETELRARGFTFRKPADGEGGQIYRNETTGEEIRIMPRPSGRWWGNDPIEKHLNQFYYRYRRHFRDVGEGPHTTISDKD